MSGIPVYTQSPINASKASDGATEASSHKAPTAPVARNVANATTSTASTTSSTAPYLPARPGQPAVPAVTAAAPRYSSFQPTQTKSNDGPPPPQPGAVPTLPNNTSSPGFNKAYEAQKETIVRTPPATLPQPYPPQMFIPPLQDPVRAQPPASSTSTTHTPSSAYPAPLPVTEFEPTRQSLEHPPGYHQNIYASESLDNQVHTPNNDHMSTLGGNRSLQQPGDVNQEGVWDTAKKWAQAAGEKMSEAESEVWRRINKK